MYASEIQSLVNEIIAFLERQLSEVRDANIHLLISQGHTKLRTISCVLPDAKTQLTTKLTQLRTNLEAINTRLEEQHARKPEKVLPTKVLKVAPIPPSLLSINLLLSYLSSKLQQLADLGSSQDFVTKLSKKYEACFTKALIEEHVEQSLKDLGRIELRINKHSISNQIEQGLDTLNERPTEHQINYLCTVFAGMGVQPVHARYLVTRLHQYGFAQLIREATVLFATHTGILLSQATTADSVIIEIDDTFLEPVISITVLYDKLVYNDLYLDLQQNIALKIRFALHWQADSLLPSLLNLSNITMDGSVTIELNDNKQISLLYLWGSLFNISSAALLQTQRDINVETHSRWNISRREKLGVSH